jgi:hypothetical protein
MINQFDFRRFDCRRFDSRRFDSRRFDSRRFDSRRFDSRCALMAFICEKSPSTLGIIPKVMGFLWVLRFPLTGNVC